MNGNEMEWQRNNTEVVWMKWKCGQNLKKRIFNTLDSKKAGIGEERKKVNDKKLIKLCLMPQMDKMDVDKSGGLTVMGLWWSLIEKRKIMIKTQHFLKQKFFFCPKMLTLKIPADDQLTTKYKLYIDNWLTLAKTVSLKFWHH